MYAPLVTGARSCRSILKSIEASGHKMENIEGVIKLRKTAFSIAPSLNRGGFECKVLEIILSSVLAIKQTQIHES